MKVDNHQNFPSPLVGEGEDGGNRKVKSPPPLSSPIKGEDSRFVLLAKDRETRARVGQIHTAHGTIHTPAFMPVGTQATVKTLAPRDLEEIGAEIILSNAYHLYIRPGIDIIKRAGGLHRFMGWAKPILTDSGGYQVFSLARLRKITDEGVTFNSHFDGREIFLTPEEVMKAQSDLGSDIAMIFDECPPHDATYTQVNEAVHRTIDWAKRAKRVSENQRQLIFGIIQGGKFIDLRKISLEETVGIGFDGYALGGVSVGEPKPEMELVVREIVPIMPIEKPRYLMGVGTPLDLFWAIESGVDLFDCVNPTRYARNGTAFTRTGKVVVRNADYSEDLAPVDEHCNCDTCRNFSRSYLRHLLNSEEILGHRLLTYHNVYFFISLVKEIRNSIREGRFAQFKEEYLSQYDESQR
ncbi:MAG: tRNA guanosine(34) transglycosylase Tgt [Candidatus Omnitrophica bacterium]|nr:tRNA guanosine(34) transglycosylase Tgt [Candidatus Omnitrophota bacterium]